MSRREKKTVYNHYSYERCLQVIQNEYNFANGSEYFYQQQYNSHQQFTDRVMQHYEEVKKKYNKL